MIYIYLFLLLQSGHQKNEEPCGKPQGINVHIPTATVATLWQATGYSQDKIIICFVKESMQKYVF
jgi:hypothetical protein